MSATGKVSPLLILETRGLYLSIAKAGVRDDVGKLQEIQKLLGFTGAMSV